MSISLVLVVVMAALYSCGIYLMLERSMTRVLLGFLLVGNATNILILTMSGRKGAAPIVDGQADPSEFADPLPQALVLTAIVITFGVSAFLLALIYRSWRLAQEDDVTDDLEDLEIGIRGVPSEKEAEQGDGDDQAGGDTEFGDRAEAAVPGGHQDEVDEDDDAWDHAPAETVPLADPEHAPHHDPDHPERSRDVGQYRTDDDHDPRGDRA
ncbi:multisubunit sodium/proton antiporter MrpC subunit [Frigoribacterium sp. PhB160]|uniref:Na(+)/H(+) antiporter subunit C n=1 Tax=Frigoribacterium sp. PhB160 TaxID=2485192 RepID=UPI000F475D41|nr:Na(+)/H(+) antiporter subunit C [Frigoribacterium sp. PhB160]ROS61874.1 multisubunit sodium/proton antiporter MrpC subunit [Frigoribacterium sp. PhB160]